MIVIRYCSVNPLYAKEFDGDEKKKMLKINNFGGG